MRPQGKMATFLAGSPIPTARTAWIFGLGIAVALFWGWKGMLAVDLGIVFLCVLDYAVGLRRKTIQTARKCPHHLLLGVSQDIEILLRNTGGESRKIQVRDQPPSEWGAAPILKGIVPERSDLRLRYRITPRERGAYAFGDIHVRLEGPLGLVLRPITFEASEEVKVLPHFQPLRHPDLATYRRMTRYWGLRPARWQGEGRDFEALREYVEGDDPRKIHWKATARFERPIVQEVQPEKNQIVMALLDAGRLMSAVSEGKSKLDHALEAAVQLVHAALAGGDQAGVLAFADRVISFVPPKRTHDQLREILQSTLSLRPLMVESRYEEAFLWLRSRVRRRSLVVVFTDLLDEIASENLLDAVALLRPRHLPLCVAIKEAEWDRLLSTPPSSVQGVYERAVLQDCIGQRTSAMRRLVEKGALAMDLPPARLSMGTMERYLEVKRRGLL